MWQQRKPSKGERDTDGGMSLCLVTDHGRCQWAQQCTEKTCCGAATVSAIPSYLVLPHPGNPIFVIFLISIWYSLVYLFSYPFVNFFILYTPIQNISYTRTGTYQCCSLLSPQAWEQCLAQSRPSVHTSWINDWINEWVNEWPGIKAWPQFGEELTPGGHVDDGHKQAESRDHERETGDW